MKKTTSPVIASPIITEDLIEMVACGKTPQFRACPEALRWLRAKPRTVAELVKYNRDWAQWAIFRKTLPPAITAALAAAGMKKVPATKRGVKRVLRFRLVGDCTREQV